MPVRQSYNVGTAASPGRLLTMPGLGAGQGTRREAGDRVSEERGMRSPAFSSLYMLFDGNRSAARNDRWRNTH